MPEFAGSGTPLSQQGFDAATAALRTSAAELWSVMSVETSGCGYLPDRRPKILFERHVFHRLTNGRFDADDPDVSNPSPGGYGPGGAHQYDRLAAAIQLDRAAALQAASWGLGQVLGQNFKTAGFADAETMVQHMVASENEQLAAMVSFMSANGIDKPLTEHDWAGFARRYNGPDYAAHNYNGLLADAFARYSARLPDLQVRTIQVLLTYKGFSPGTIDGVSGSRTTAAIEAFQRSIGKSATGEIDAQLISDLNAQG